MLFFFFNMIFLVCWLAMQKHTVTKPNSKQNKIDKSENGEMDRGVSFELDFKNVWFSILLFDATLSASRVWNPRFERILAADVFNMDCGWV